MKKSWNKPELTVLVRTRPEEAILGNCKNPVGAGDPQQTNNRCLSDNPFGGTCVDACIETANS